MSRGSRLKVCIKYTQAQGRLVNVSVCSIGQLLCEITGLMNLMGVAVAVAVAWKHYDYVLTTLFVVTFHLLAEAEPNQQVIFFICHRKV